MEDVVSTQPNSEFVPVNAQWDAETVTVQAGRPSRRPGASMNAPITLSSTYVHTSELGYGRDGNQTWAALEEALGKLDGGIASTFSSGLAATTAIADLIPSGGTIEIGRAHV